MLNVAHVKNDVKWRSIVTKFGTLVDNMSRMRLHDYHIFFILFDDYMRNSNFGIGVLHVKVKYWRIFLWRHQRAYIPPRVYICSLTSFLYSLNFLLFHRIEYPKRCIWQNIEMFLLLSFCDMTVPSKCNVPSLWPWPLTYEVQYFLVNWVLHLISILYKFQIDISSNSREIKYQNIGRTHTRTHTNRQTDRQGENNTKKHSITSNTTFMGCFVSWDLILMLFKWLEVKVTSQYHPKCNKVDIFGVSVIFIQIYKHPNVVYLCG